METSVYPRKHEAMEELREITAKHPMLDDFDWFIFPLFVVVICVIFKIVSELNRNRMTTSADQAQFLSMLLKLMNARTPWKLVCSPATLSWPQPSPFPQMERLGPTIRQTKLYTIKFPNLTSIITVWALILYLRNKL